MTQDANQTKHGINIKTVLVSFHCVAILFLLPTNTCVPDEKEETTQVLFALLMVYSMVYLTIIPQALVGYEMTDSQRGA